MNEKWRFVFMDDCEETTPDNVELKLDGGVYFVFWRRPGVGCREVQASYPAVNVRKAVRVRG